MHERCKECIISFHSSHLCPLYLHIADNVDRERVFVPEVEVIVPLCWLTIDNIEKGGLDWTHMFFFLQNIYHKKCFAQCLVWISPSSLYTTKLFNHERRHLISPIEYR